MKYSKLKKKEKDGKPRTLVLVDSFCFRASQNTVYSPFDHEKNQNFSI